MAKVDKPEWMKVLSKVEGAVMERNNPHNEVLQSPSPSCNFIYGNGWGLPFGFTEILFGPPGSGKSVLCNAKIGQLHKDYPEAIAVKFNTEMREATQLIDYSAWGIDPDRYMCFDMNSAVKIFDTIAKEIHELCQNGVPIKLIVIDSLTQLEGRIAENQESVGDVVIGDESRTLGLGLKRILPIIRKYKIALVLSTHLRAEMDAMKVRMTHDPTRMAASWAVQHFAEYFIRIDRMMGKDGRSNLIGEEFIDDNFTDIAGNADRTAYKARVKMVKSSVGPEGRTGMFTFDFNKGGIINTHEEVFLLGLNRGIIQKPSNTTYEYKDRKWVGQKNMLLALKQDADLANEIIKQVRMQDIEKKYSSDGENAIKTNE